MSQPLKVIFIPIHPFSLISNPVPAAPVHPPRAQESHSSPALGSGMDLIGLKMEDLPSGKHTKNY